MASVPVIPDSYNHVLAELECLDPLLSALRLDSSRLKCTCIDVSKRWLALGSSGGGLNLIQKDGWKQRLFLTHKEGAISRVACCLHDEDYVAVATSQGLVVVWELNQERRGKPERIYVSSEHKGRKVTALCWDTAALRVFVGDHVGKVSAIKINTSKQGKAAATFVMFPVQIITTVDSRVVQLDYLDGRLLISSLTRTYLCDTERQKFWKIGNKERDGEFGACFFPVGKNSGNQQPLIYCARPGSRMWEVNFDGEVQSTHQFKQLLSSPPLPVVTLRQDPHYTGSSCSPQSLSFPKLLYLTEHCVVTWTERGIYIFLPQSVQVLLWSEVKDIQDIAVYKSELFCLHTNGKVVHLSLLLVDRCVERLMRRGFWTLAARVSCLFQNSIISCRARKNLPLDKLEHLKSQLDASTQQDLTMQLEELISKLEPLDSACSSRRSSISSHESFSVLDSGIYRVISRRGSQSDEDSCSLHSQTFSEDERLKEFPAHQEDEQVDLDNVCHASVVVEADRNETFLPFSIPLSFRSPSPLVQAVKESVSSFVRKTTEKIGTLHISPDTKGRQEAKDDEQLPELTANLVASPQEEKELEPQSCQLPEEDRLRDLKAATAEALAKLQDPQILLEPQCMRRVLQEWLVYLEEKFSSKDHSPLSSKKSKAVCAEEQRAVVEENLRLGPADGDPVDKEQSSVVEGCIEKGNTDETCVSKTMCENSTDLRGPLDCGFQVSPLCVLEPDVQKDLVDLTTLCFELRVFPWGSGDAEEGSDGSLPLAAVWTLACRFMRRYFFLLDLKRVKQCIITTYATSPNVWETYIAGLKELTCHSPVALAMESEDMLKVLKLLHDLGPWDDSPLLLVHAQRLYEKFGETALRPLIKFYPSILPSDIKQLCRNDPAHFLAYLDSLVKSKPEDKRPSLLRSLLQPESLRLDWLCLAVSHDAPQRANTVDAEGNPRPRSHLFTWGYSQLILLLIKLPADFATKEKMAHICKLHGFWPGYLFLCLELDRRIEAFTNIAHLDDLSLLNGEDGCIPETIEEWKFLLHLAQNHSTALHHHGQQNGNAVSNGGTSCPDCITVENVALLLARAIGPNRALPLLQECGLTPELSERFTGVCEILRIAEKRQRALIQSMLERCDRFLWSQQA
ncbi:BLOC-2 complex member HPS5 isoform X1 [Manacus candei]|uniref:BLOC-2 complex member HPS5 isoform X1 n=1 Tax=Manacus candei TaxID=415023 RepID=UPI002227AF76|nr:BLOC-2 complex member HPS5 isoform X1 [Manacus candei]XP_051660335.1 BLOC-2 complex member HPS5 isoform X1 [Manacus candei]XP_051660336.1 BLOC-2 complex member HPS5 isoform X1 [Manacus candei]XP_051660338.1 BLOC-2 complex member HPS5 isoform X1 [Manacus candei]XP_051660339.1 BLOC-2 complex member HPS5 isoform X1 [Manacus candei]XP_051660340.1 BLOC-2 complex member HPS5 isoform X1 [Manacus candei]XP_051660341.1 BLOC-2 complex member HPS5 isoform X1 [Manacus candei]XP_051660342.1 BLOC-2 com